MPKLGDPDYDFAAFSTEITGGSLRWLASVLAVLSAALLVMLVAAPGSPAIPWFLKGTIGFVIVGAALALWTVLAVVNWRAHSKDDRR